MGHSERLSVKVDDSKVKVDAPKDSTKRSTKVAKPEIEK